MKLLLSLVAAIAATTVLLFALPGTARANASATTIPNPSGHVTCTGKNPDGSAAAWTVGGHIYYISDVANPTAIYPWHNIKPSTSGNPYDGSGGASCTSQVVTLSNVQSGCALITGSLDIYYTASSGSSGQENVYVYKVPTPTANNTYSLGTLPISFQELDNVNNVQYKVTSAQGGPTLGTAATSYL